MLGAEVQEAAAKAPQSPESAAFWGKMEMQRKESQELQVKIEEFCSRWCPEQMHLAPFLAIEFCGREDELEAHLAAMYGHSLSETPRAGGKQESAKGVHSLVASGANDATTHADTDCMAQAVTLCSFYGLGRHFVPAVYAQTKRTGDRRRTAWGAWRPREEEEEGGAAEGTEKEEERRRRQTVLFEVLLTLFPDFLCGVLERGAQRTAFVVKRLAAFLSFHEPESSVKKYLVSRGGLTDARSTFRSVIMKHYRSLIKESAGISLSIDDLDEVSSLSSSSVVTVESAGGGEDTTSRRRKTKSMLRDWTTAYGLRTHPTPIPSRSCAELHDVAIDTEELTAMEQMRALKQQWSRTEMGTMTQSQPSAYGVGVTNPLTRRLYGTVAPFRGVGHGAMQAAAARRGQNWPQSPAGYILPNPSIVQEANNCQKCVFLEAQLAEAKAKFQHAYSMAVANEEQRYYNEASFYAKHEQLLSLAAASQVNNSSVGDVLPCHVVQPSFECLMCNDLRQRIKCLEQKLRDSYDASRELAAKLRRSQLPPPPHMCVISSSAQEMKKKSVSTMTELTGKKLDEFVGYMILESL